ncbi:hypothetical protein [Bradyrhizobium forestalis]|uniref:hypothetical protein n=1 Tax=Bradyrhizobium forestalis TaxID=1419263 RepID=UPI001FDFE9A1|nr:hypothetical protein [Bradyrhizobium forestalis]
MRFDDASIAPPPAGRGDAAVGFGVMVVLLNGLFQEEALFAPLALGLMLSLAGLVIGSHVRMQTVASEDAELAPLTGYRTVT